jgi:hypothetical protein
VTDEQINKAIAEHLSMDWSITPHRYRGIDEPLSPCLDCGLSDDNSVHDGGCRTEDAFIHDPAMRDLLQERLLEQGWIVLTMYMNPNKLVHIEISRDSEGMNSIEFASLRERTWPLAYIKANGLEEYS